MRPCSAKSPAPAPPCSRPGAPRNACSRWPPSRFATGRRCWMSSQPRWRGGRTLRSIHRMMILSLILVVALMIPIIAILVDSPLGRSIARRLEGRSEGGGGGGGGNPRGRRGAGATWGGGGGGGEPAPPPPPGGGGGSG